MDYILLQSTPFGLECWWWWAWTLGAMLLGCLICRFLFGGGGKDQTEEINKLSADRDRYHGLATKWEKDYNSLKYQLEESQKGEADLRAALQSCEADKQTLSYKLEKATVVSDDGDKGIIGIAGGLDGDDGSSASGDSGSVYAGLFPDDNLQIIEGVGPKIDGLLKAAGYTNWSQVAATDEASLRKVLADAGSRYKLADPTSWPHQAGLAAAGKWEELIKYQKFTDAGRETTGDFETPSKFEKLAVKKLGFSSMKPDDLKVVEGIGPKIEGLFKAEGINTWQDLANTSVERMQEILTAAGDRYRLANPGTWGQQAQLAASGEWGKLNALQDELKGGK